MSCMREMRDWAAFLKNHVTVTKREDGTHDIAISVEGMTEMPMSASKWTMERLHVLLNREGLGKAEAMTIMLGEGLNKPWLIPARDPV